MCGKLRVSMYGTRDAAMNWATEYGETLKQAGFVQGKSSACLFYHKARDVAVMVHGDDFVAVGDPKYLAETEAALSKKYKIKTEMLGADEGDLKEIKVLNKIIRLTDSGLELEADPRHAELVVRELGVENCKVSKVPGSKATGERERDGHRVTRPSKTSDALSTMDDESEGEVETEDVWINIGEDGVWRRRHSVGRRSLFTPSGTAGSPRRPSSLSGKRTTEGIYEDDGEEFIIVDDWKDARYAHRRLSRSWTGTTTFEVDCTRRSIGSRISGTDEASGPADEQDEDRESERAVPKPGQDAVQVKKSAGKIVEIRHIQNDDIDDQGDIDGVDDTWDFLSTDDGKSDIEDPPLEGAEATCYRSVTARLNYIAPDRVDIQYATKEAARHMAIPRASHFVGLTKIGKYLAGRPRLVMHFKWQKEDNVVTGFTDSDWAGCMATAKSTSGGIISIGTHAIKTYSRQQKTVALSSAEAELHAMVAASAETLGVIGLCEDLGMRMMGEILADSSAALGISNRTGVGKVRHLRIQALWVQEVRSTGRLGYKKVLGTLNPSDVLTKHVPGDLLDAHLKSLGMEVRGGRAGAAPTLDSVTIEYVSDWVEVVKDRRVSFSNVASIRPIPAAGRGRPVKYDKKIGRPWADEGSLERGVDSIVESDADIENDDYGEVFDMSMEFLGECCSKPLSVDDIFIVIPGECCAKPLDDEDLRRRPAVPLRGTADTNKNTATAEHSTPMKSENLIMPDDQIDIRSRDDMLLNRPRAVRRKFAHPKPYGSYYGSRQAATVSRFGLGAAGIVWQATSSTKSEFTPRGSASTRLLVGHRGRDGRIGRQSDRQIDIPQIESARALIARASPEPDQDPYSRLSAVVIESRKSDRVPPSPSVALRVQTIIGLTW